MRVRRPSAWGFYSWSQPEAEREIESCFLSNFGPGEKRKAINKGKRSIIGAVVPHAGYVYSGPIASHVYYKLAEDGNPGTFVLLGPNHDARYPGFCTMLEGTWKMPFGKVTVDSDLARAIVEHSQFVDVNPEAHDREHSIEVQLPFLQYVYASNFKIVPITAGFSDYAMCLDVGAAIVKAIKEKKSDAVIIASTDFTHYGRHYGYVPAGIGPFEKVRKWIDHVDHSLIDLILAFKAEQLVNTVTEKGFTMCGALPVATMIVAVKELGARNGELLKYATSYDTQGSADLIVGYGAIIITA